jgi:hypothetical protein
MSTDTDSSTTSSSYSTSSSSYLNPLTGGKKKSMKNMSKKMQMMMSRASSRSAWAAGGKSRKQKMRGGYTSATTWGEHVNGSGDSQWARVFENGVSPTPNGNLIVGAEGQNSIIPASVRSSGMIGGKKRSNKKGGQNGPPMMGGKRKSRSKKGGYWAQVINQALVPFGLWGMQNRYGKRGTRKQKK